MKPVILRFVADGTVYDQGNTLNWFWDGGGGSMDWTSPLNPTPIPLFPFVVPISGWGLDGWGRSSWADGIRYGGWGLDLWGDSSWGRPGAILKMRTHPLPPGTYQFAPLIYDSAGNVATYPTPKSVVVTDVPEPPRDLAASSYDPGTNVLTLNFTESETFLGAVA